ncbi:META domain-containing protein [Corynebacterium nasicanis]|uniref:META domain-containing protein n=1 Tax=Corynebacterium nasicanis TaxID=1448267 RepID=A0ABW1QE51_9CORY
MKRALIFLALALTACSGEPEVSDTTWQVTDIWTTPGDPSTLPPQDAGRAWLALGGQSLSGNTGCSRLQGTVTFSEDGETLSIDHLEVDPAAADCPAERTHGQLTELLRPGAEFAVHHAGRSLTLTARSDAVDPPAIGLAAL